MCMRKDSLTRNQDPAFVFCRFGLCFLLFCFCLFSFSLFCFVSFLLCFLSFVLFFFCLFSFLFVIFSVLFLFCLLFPQNQTAYNENKYICPSPHSCTRYKCDSPPTGTEKKPLPSHKTRTTYLKRCALPSSVPSLPIHRKTFHPHETKRQSPPEWEGLIEVSLY